MYDSLKPSYEEIHNACKDIANLVEVKCPSIKRIAGIARGGLLPATILSHMLKLPLIVIDYSSKNGKGDDKNHENVFPHINPQDGSILVVDDICDSGFTLNEVVFELTKQNVEVFTAVLFYKTYEQQVMNPDFIWKTIPHDAGWVIFPYERNEYLEADVNGATRHLESLIRT